MGTTITLRVVSLGFLIRAYCTFDGSGGTGNKTIVAGYNVTTVNKTGTGRYTLTFPAGALPTAGYAPIICGKATVANVEIMSFIRGATTTSTTSLSIGFSDAGGNLPNGYRDVSIGSVVIVGG